MIVAAYCRSSCFPVCVLVGSSALGQHQDGPVPHAASSLAHEGLVLPLVGKQSQEHGILPLIEAEGHAERDTIQQTAVLQMIQSSICFLVACFFFFFRSLIV